jgi:hypothetical protein
MDKETNFSPKSCFDGTIEMGKSSRLLALFCILYFLVLGLIFIIAICNRFSNWFSKLNPVGNISSSETPTLMKNVQLM